MYLLDKGANPNAADGFYKRTPLFAAIEARNLDYAHDSAPPVPIQDPLDLIKRCSPRVRTPAPAPTPPVEVSCR
jgi:hypothetical protein